jgi:hypothetical protein
LNELERKLELILDDRNGRSPIAKILGRLSELEQKLDRELDLRKGNERSLDRSGPTFWPRGAVTEHDGRFRIPGDNPTPSVCPSIWEPQRSGGAIRGEAGQGPGPIEGPAREVLDLGEVRVRFHPVP